jgi:mRNA deadenylase 3'-5' endonuclease subunit Ccr4
MEFAKYLTLEPPMTCYNKGMMSNLDYIFFKGDIRVVRALDSPDVNMLTKDQGYMPNEFYPSDHISICADFILP